MSSWTKGGCPWGQGRRQQRGSWVPEGPRGLLRRPGQRLRAGSSWTDPVHHWDGCANGLSDPEGLRPGDCCPLPGSARVSSRSTTPPCLCCPGRSDASPLRPLQDTHRKHTRDYPPWGLPSALTGAQTPPTACLLSPPPVGPWPAFPEHRGCISWPEPLWGPPRVPG